MDKVLIAVVGVLVGALATGGLQVAMRFWELRLAARVAARIVQGDAYVAGAAFQLLDESKEWFRLDFDPALRTWAEHRTDLAAILSSPDWARVGSFYSNLERSAAMAREPGEPATEGDLKVARDIGQTLSGGVWGGDRVGAQRIQMAVAPTGASEALEAAAGNRRNGRSAETGNRW